MEYIELNISLRPRDPWAEILIADLAENGYESFVETEEGIMAYGRSVDVNFDQPLKGTLLDQNDGEFTFEIETKIIPHENWNAIWEADFHPVVVEPYCTILAPFHNQSEVVGIHILIQPQMSFGTGHHQTTYMMTKALFEIVDLSENVLDMGTGTGVLAIVAEKLGAKRIVAVDIEDWSVENTLENAERNGCTRIDGICGDIDFVPAIGYGLILANINKNVLKSHMQSYCNLLNTNGVILLSGFFESDATELLKVCNDLGLYEIGRLAKEEWCCLKLKKN
jgi:ribosomal protein L11 methyltransferase